MCNCKKSVRNVGRGRNVSRATSMASNHTYTPTNKTRRMITKRLK